MVLEHELKSFSIVFSMADIHRIIGPNAARFVGMENEIGSLEQGKRADIILLDGDPTKNIYGMLKTKVVLKDGKVVVESAPLRRQRQPGAPGRLVQVVTPPRGSRLRPCKLTPAPPRRTGSAKTSTQAGTNSTRGVVSDARRKYLPQQPYDVARDGRFLIVTELDSASSEPIHLLLNWHPPAK